MIYVVGAARTSIVKIGYTDGDVGVRLRMLQTGNHQHLIVHWTVEGDRALEAHLHRAFRTYRLRGEWFDLNTDRPAAAVRDAVRTAPLWVRPLHFT